MNTRRIVLLGLSIGLCSVLNGCLKPSAIDDLAKVSDLAATLFPAVAQIPYESCVTIEQNAQLANIASFTGEFAFDQTSIAAKCKSAQDTSTRLQTTYAVLTTYITTLDKLAGGNVPTYDTNIKTLAGQLPGLSSTQQTAVSGLASVVADVVDKQFRQAKAAEAIHQAEPWVQEVCKMLGDQLPRFLTQYINNQVDSLASMHRDISTFRLNGTVYYTSPILVAKGFAEDRATIQKQQDAVAAFGKIFADVATAHTALDRNRNKLWDTSTIQQLFQTASDIKKQVDAVNTAVSPTRRK